MARIYKRHGRWIADYFRQGRRIRTSLRTTRKEEAHRRFKELLRTQPVPKEESAGKDILLGILLKDYLAFARAEKSPRLAKEEGYILRKFLASIPARTARQIEFAHIRDYKVAISSKKPNTIRNHLKAIRSLLNYAMNSGFLARNPAREIKLPRQPKQAPKYLTPGQLGALLSALPKRSRDIVYFFAKTGLRLSEGLALRRDDIKRGWMIVRQTKNPGQGFRTLPVDGKIRALVGRQPKAGEYVFRITRQQLRDDFEKARRKVGLEWATIHTLRHTFASHLVMAGVPIRTVQELLGHAQIQTTMIYAHLSMEHLEGAVTKLPY